MRHTHDRSNKHNVAFSAELAMDLPIGPRQVSQLSPTYLLLGWFGSAPLLAHIERANEFSQDVQLGAASHLRIVEQDLGFGKLAGLTACSPLRRSSGHGPKSFPTKQKRP